MRRFLVNVASNYSVAAVDGLLFVLVTPLVVHNLGVVQYSVWVILQTIGYYLGFLDFGLVDAQVRQHARLKAARDFRGLQSLLDTVVFLYLAAGVAGIAIAVLLTATPIDRWLDISPDLQSVFPVALVILGVYNLFSLTNRGISAMYEAEERFDAMNVMHIAVTVCRAAAVVVAMLAGYGLIALFVLQVAFAAAACAVKLAWMPKIVPHVARPRPRMDRASWDSVKHYSLWNSLNDFMTEGTAHFDKLLIPVFLGAALVGPYSLVVTVAAAVFVVADPITSTFLPMFSRVGASRSREPTRILLSRGTRLVLLFTAPVAVVIGFFGDALLDLWIGAEYTAVPPAVLWFTIGNFFFSTMLWTPLNVLMAAGHIRRIFWISVAEVLLVLALIVVLAPHYGLTGLAFAGFAANVVIGLAFFIPIACREAGESPFRFVRATIGMPLAAAAPAAAVAALLQPSVNLATWTGALTACCVAGLTCFAGVAIFAIPRMERIRYFVTFRQLVRP